MTEQQWSDLGFKASEAFTPAAPIDTRELFAGRIGQLRRVIDAVQQKGQHAIIFGERGVGKTSLASVISEYLSVGSIVVPRANCESRDTYSTLWKKLFRQIELTGTRPAMGLSTACQTSVTNLVEQLDSIIMPDDVLQALAILSNECLPILVIDEFDRIGRAEVKTAVADTIKALSDHGVRATVVLVGVADSVDDLLAEHQSIERALKQIQMPRMSVEELHAILDNGLKLLGMSIEDEARREIALLSKGLPHYVHLLGLHSAREAIDAKSLRIGRAHVESAISTALEEVQETIESAYHQATERARKDNLYSHVLLACALASADARGYFSAADVRTPLSVIMEKRYDIPSYARHLYDFCESASGRLLQRTGVPRRYRFRFTNPLMQPYVIMQGRKTGLINEAKLLQIRQVETSTRPSPTGPGGLDGNEPALFC